MKNNDYNCKIIVATHKRYRMPDDRLYLPLHVGAAKCGFIEKNGIHTNSNSVRKDDRIDSSKKNYEIDLGNLGYQKDSTGDNISEKNANYCELTGLYWAWKNLNADYLGLTHYRRHFSSGRILLTRFARAGRNGVVPGIPSDKWRRVLTSAQLRRLLQDTDVILPKPRNYFIETNYSQYAHALHAVDLDTTRIIISEKYSDYLDAYDRVMKKTSGHRFNMFIMKREVLDAYLAWLFDILFDLEKRLDISDYSENDSRVFGFVSERLLDVWIEKNNISYKEIPVLYMEHQNWIKKGGAFLGRKFNLSKQK